MFLWWMVHTGLELWWREWAENHRKTYAAYAGVQAGLELWWREQAENHRKTYAAYAGVQAGLELWWRAREGLWNKTSLNILDIYIVKKKSFLPLIYHQYINF